MFLESSHHDALIGQGCRSEKGTTKVPSAKKSTKLAIFARGLTELNKIWKIGIHGGPDAVCKGCRLFRGTTRVPNVPK